MKTSASKIPWGALLGIGVLSCVGLAMIGLAFANFLLNPGASDSPTQVANVTSGVATVVVIPTITPGAVDNPTATPAAPTATQATAATNTEAAAAPTATPKWQLQINLPANVRTGPGLTYPVIGGINPGEPNSLIGRDASSQWFVVAYDLAADGQGWISNQVAAFNGNINDLPILQPSGPPPAPSNTPKPAATNTNPPPAATNTPAGYSSRGIVGQAFWVENTTAGPGQDIWFNFKVTNTSSSDVSYGVLAAHIDNGPNAQSWSNETLKAGKTLEWRDHINISTPGTYQIYLGICYGNNNSCVANTAPWERLSPSVTITVR